MFTRFTLGVLAAGAGLLVVPAGVARPAGERTITYQKRTPTSQQAEAARKGEPVPPLTGREAGAVGVPVQVEWARFDPTKTVVVVCDMWDDHWCTSAAKRCNALARKAEPVLRACREQGMTVVHAPSDCMGFYKDHPARKRMLAVKKVDVPKDKEVPCPPLPIDDSDGGCDDPGPTPFRKAWTRQHAAITIDPDVDFVSDNGREVYSLMKEKGLTTVVVMGVHTNMCVLNRSFAVKQMVRWGMSVLLVRDLTDAMYNPAMKPNVTHDRGTELVIEYIETWWCPTVEAKALMK